MAKNATGEWRIMPHVGVGPLRFGMNRLEVRALLGANVSTFKKTPWSLTDTDAYNDLGFHLYYDRADRLECVEAWGPSCIVYEDMPLVNGTTQETLEGLAKLGLIHGYDDGYLFDTAGFALYAPGDKVEAVTVYRDGYYDGMTEEVNRAREYLARGRQPRD